MKKIGTAVLLFLVLLSCFPICGYAIEFDMDEICDSVVVVHSMNSVGTGFAISKDKIVTNQHVVSTTTTYTIETRDGGLYNGRLIASDEAKDLSLIEVLGGNLPTIPMTEDIPPLGTDVYAVGSPQGMGFTVSRGILSTTDRQLNGVHYIQTDAAINPGNSGGALLNMKGEVIGINSAKFASNAVEGMGYAIPISKAQPILEDLMSRETRDKVDSSEASYLGINPLDLSAEVTAMFDMPEGVFVSSVNTGEAADNAGIRKGDIITGFDGQTVTGRDDLNDKMKYYAAGETVDITIARAQNGQYMEQTVQVTLGSRPSAD